MFGSREPMKNDQPGTSEDIDIAICEQKGNSNKLIIVWLMGVNIILGLYALLMTELWIFCICI